MPGMLVENVVSQAKADLITEAIILRHGRPGFLVQQGTFQPSSAWQHLTQSVPILSPYLNSVGRIELPAGENGLSIGTGWVYKCQ